MDLFRKIKLYVDYNNTYSINKTLNTLRSEFDIAVLRKNFGRAKEIVIATKQLYEDFSKTYRESEDYGETMSYLQKRTANNMRNIIAYLLQQLKQHCRANRSYENQIADIINIQKE